MDDSDQDFVDLRSKLLKRVRRKAGETVSERKTNVAESSSQDSTKDVPPTKRQAIRRKKNVGITFKGPLGRSVKTQHICDQLNLVPSNPDISKPALVIGVAEVGDGENSQRAKDKVLHRMQQFRRVSPQKLVHGGRSPLAEAEDISDTLPQCSEPSTSAPPHSPGPASTPIPPDPRVGDSDEALALRLQEELDREAQSGAVDLERGGLFFCQLCQRDLSTLSPAGRTQHINRCLDESEDGTATHAPPAPPRIPECPICGKRFRSPKSRAAHLKRCSSTMGVAPAVLLQAVQRQAAEGLTDDTGNQPQQVGGSKHKGPTDTSIPTRKKPKRKPPGLDEDTMVALALSRSLLEQEREREGEMQREMEGGQQHLALLPHFSLSPLKLRAETSKGRGKRKKGVASRPPPLLLVQDPEAALRRLQERVTTLLLCPRVSSPPTPTRCPSSLTSCSGTTLWQKSTLPAGGSKEISEFYTPELRDIIAPWVSGKLDVVTPSKAKADPSDTHSSIREGTPLTVENQPPSTQGAGNLPVSSQTLCDLMELAEEGMTLTQWGYSATGPVKDRVNSASDLRLSGFVPENTDDHPDLCLSGFIPERRVSEDHGRKSVSQHVETNEKSVALSRLASDLSSMVNNPQLSDVQLQVDSGEVYFAHSFMLYARCPLLAQMVHDSGFGVQEEGVPPAQRVLLGDVAGQAVWSMLQYLYTACCPPLSPSLLPHLQELAVRFDLEVLQQLCQLHPGQTQGDPEGQAGVDYLDLEHPTGGEEEHRDKVFAELLRSMWNEDEKEEDEGRAEGEEDGRTAEGERRDVMLEEGEMNEEKVNEDEMEEIYQFAASQRKKDDGKEQLDEEDEEEGVTFFTETEDQEGSSRSHTLAKEAQVIPLKAPSLAEHPFSTEEGNKPEDAGRGDMDSHQGRPSEPNITSLREVSDRCPHPIPDGDLDLKVSLDRSYNRLFSDSWGAYDTQTDPRSSPASPPRASPKHSRSQHPRTKEEVMMCPNPTYPLSPRSGPSEVRVDGCTTQPEVPTLQASASKVIDLTFSPPMVPGVSTLPIRDCSPGEVANTGGRGRTEEVGGAVGVMVPVCMSSFQDRTHSSQEDCKTHRRGLSSSSASLSPPHSSQQPELIVLSDSSEEMELGDLAPDGSPSTPPIPLPRLSQNQPDYTRISTQSNTKKSTLRNKLVVEPGTPTSRTQSDPDPEKSSLKEKESSPGSAGPDQSLMDCSAELSWLIPATPPMVSKTSSSTQTFSSMRRTQLFPKNNFSVSSASVFSSPVPPSKRSLQTSNTSDPPNSAQAESSVSRHNPNHSGPWSSRLGDSSFWKYKCGAVSSNPADKPTEPPVFVIPPFQRKRSRLPSQNTSVLARPPPDPSTKGTPLYDVSQPYSSTPLHAHLTKPPALSLASPLLGGSRGESEASQRGSKGEESQSPGKRDILGDLGSLCLSLSDHSSSPPRVAALSQPTEGSGCPSRHRHSAESAYFHSPGDGEKASGVTGRSDKPMEMEELERSVAKEKDKRGEPEEVERSGSFRQSFLEMDEPAMAFDDSWGLDGGGDAGIEPSQQVCFSLRLESSSGGGSPPEQGYGGREVAGPSSTLTSSPPPKSHTTPSTPSPPRPITPQANPEINASLLANPEINASLLANPEINASLLANPEMWEDWGDDTEEALPLSQRVNNMALTKRVAQLKTPVVSRKKGQQCPMVPITPMPSYSDMDTPDLKNQLNRFGVRPLPKRQMILKLKEIHQYTHQVISSESEDEAPSLGRPPPVGPLSTGGDPSRPVSCALTGRFKEHRVPVPPAASSGGDEGLEALSASQGSSASSTAPSEASDRFNPERCLSGDDSDSDSALTASQAVSSLQDRLVAISRFIQSDPQLYGQILQYQPLVLSDLQVRLKAAGIRLGAAKLLDYLDSQCITFTTAKPRVGGERKGRGRGRRGLQGGIRGRRRRGAAPVLD
ncbi:structure-specific endonuclease subunit SLX4 isoform X2 [Esox lucius]|uniref:structure-specific endonuclease subunit SLX4 isoform X2 n=1 Tax=Esox lucius TaxID=8010 RepID=UPI0014771EA2|nr:structure-specific endonuclease subunit SLX4 isoform X2 [Esox lucius]